MQGAIQYLLGLGAAVVVGLIIFLIGLLVKAGVQRSLSAAITLGVAFSGVGLVIGYMVNGIAPAGKAMIDATGVQLNTLDFGWTAGAAITWAWQYAVLMFPVQIGINIAMLALKWTDCLNVDMWNVWGKIFVAALVSDMTGNVIAAWALCAVWIVLELKSADYTHKQVQLLTGIPGVSCPHLILLDNILLAPVAWLLDRMPVFDKLKTDPQALRDKIGILGENHIIGFLLGFLIALIGGLDLAGMFATAFVGATGLTLMPKVAALFMEALAPISEAAGDFMKSRFAKGGRDFHIGLDWPILAGLPSLWTAAILLIPVLLLFAVILPGNKVLPFGSILLIESTIGTVILAKNDLVKTWIYGVLITIARFYTATVFAGAITRLATTTQTFELKEGFENFTWLGMSYMNWVLLALARMFSGQQVIVGIIVLVVMAACVYLWRNMMKERELEAKLALGE